MKKSTNLFIALAIVIGLIIGFLVGISVDFPDPQSAELSGTIGRINNYSNVSLSDEDIQLRDDLLNDIERQEAYANYYSFHYGAAAELTAALEVAVKASENLSDFKNINQAIINNLKRYQQSIGQSRKELLLALNVLQSADKVDPSDFGEILNNANIAIAQMNYNDETIVNFIDEAGNYLTGKSGSKIVLLSKAYNHLLLLQATKAIACNNKPKMKYLDKKELFALSEELSFRLSQEKLNDIVSIDQVSLKYVMSNEMLEIVKINSEEILKAISIGNAEQLKFMSNGSLGSTIDIEKLRTSVMGSEIGQLGGFTILTSP
ncbi:MAG: hypothetical protein PF541_01975 [Prolixibacteraceae bacterium]|jgi:hypothetical protein|nr:hypothetical protein [Prolixibacteraceae bacterium]